MAERAKGCATSMQQEIGVSNRTLVITDEIYDYLTKVALREPASFRRLRARTAQMSEAHMQIAPEQGQFMHLLVELLGARRAIELGTFTGYSALWIAAALPEDGRLICCDVNRKWTAIAKRHWKEAGLADRIDLRIGRALTTLDRLLAGGHAGTFDFAFIDADKQNYDNYYERVLRLLRPGGLLAIDNAFRHGAVVTPAAGDVSAVATDALNRKIKKDKRVTSSLVPIADGLMLARKR